MSESSQTPDPQPKGSKNATSRANKQRRNRGILSCMECHKRKQKCDRLYPCGDCVQRGVSYRCKYQAALTGNPNGEQASDALNSSARLRRIIRGEEVLLTPESVAGLQSNQAQLPKRLSTEEPVSNIPLRQLPDELKPTIVSAANIQFLGGFDPFSILPSTDGEPIKKQALIHYFLRRLAPWLSYLDDEATSTSPKISWLPFALHHPALFHATLLTAAVHLNRYQPMGDQRALLWYKVETMRLANERLTCPNEAAKDEMIIVVLVLLYFNVGGNNRKEYEMHLNGIHQMLKVRGGKEKLGMRGMLRNWLNVCHGPWEKDWEYIYPI